MEVAADAAPAITASSVPDQDGREGIRSVVSDPSPTGMGGRWRLDRRWDTAPKIAPSTANTMVTSKPTTQTAIP
jgi:hypothetical protein